MHRNFFDISCDSAGSLVALRFLAVWVGLVFVAACITLTEGLREVSIVTRLTSGPVLQLVIYWACAVIVSPVVVVVFILGCEIVWFFAYSLPRKVRRNLAFLLRPPPKAAGHPSRHIRVTDN